MRRLRLILLAAAFLLVANSLSAGEPPAAAPAPPSAQTLADITQFTQLAALSVEHGDLDMAERFYSKLLAIDAPDDSKKQALFDMFECYRDRHIYSKAITVGETLHQLFPSDLKTPDLLLKLGQLYRETGAYQLAINRFYNILNAALRVDPAQFAKYRDYSTQAQFEIAETLMTAGDFQRAARTYSLLDRLDLSPDEKAHTQFQIAYCSFLIGDYPAAVSAAQRFLESYGDSEDAPQGHYLLSVALKAIGRSQQAADETLTLLKLGNSLAARNPDAAIYWQKKTGNEIANAFYQEGDYLHALTIYQAMAKLSDDPDWQLPVIYQVGLCFERLLLPDRAAEAYRYILDEGTKAQTAGKTLGDDLTELTHMADWRSQHLTWKEGAQAQLEDLIGPSQPAGIPGIDTSGLKVTQTP